MVPSRWLVLLSLVRLHPLAVAQTRYVASQDLESEPRPLRLQVLTPWRLAAEPARKAPPPVQARGAREATTLPQPPARTGTLASLRQTLARISRDAIPRNTTAGSAETQDRSSTLGHWQAPSPNAGMNGGNQKSVAADPLLASAAHGLGDLSLYETSSVSGDDSTPAEEAAALELLEAVPTGGGLTAGLKAGLPSMDAAAVEATVMESSLDWTDGSSMDEAPQWIPARAAAAAGARPARAFDAAFDADFTTSGEEESEEELEAALRLVLQEEEFERQFGLPVVPSSRKRQSSPMTTRRQGRAFDAAFDADFTTSGEEESEEELEAALRLVLQEEEFEQQFGLPVEPKRRRFRPTPRAELFMPPRPTLVPDPLNLEVLATPAIVKTGYPDVLAREMSGLTDVGPALQGLLLLEEEMLATSPLARTGGSSTVGRLDAELLGLTEELLQSPRRGQSVPLGRDRWHSPEEGFRDGVVSVGLASQAVPLAGTIGTPPSASIDPSALPAVVVQAAERQSRTFLGLPASPPQTGSFASAGPRWGVISMSELPAAAGFGQGGSVGPVVGSIPAPAATATRLPSAVAIREESTAPVGDGGLAGEFEAMNVIKELPANGSQRAFAGKGNSFVLGGVALEWIPTAIDGVLDEELELLATAWDLGSEFSPHGSDWRRDVPDAGLEADLETLVEELNAQTEGRGNEKLDLEGGSLDSSILETLMGEQGEDASDIIAKLMGAARAGVASMATPAGWPRDVHVRDADLGVISSALGLGGFGAGDYHRHFGGADVLSVGTSIVSMAQFGGGGGLLGFGTSEDELVAGLPDVVPPAASGEEDATAALPRIDLFEDDLPDVLPRIATYEEELPIVRSPMPTVDGGFVLPNLAPFGRGDGFMSFAMSFASGLSFAAGNINIMFGDKKLVEAARNLDYGLDTMPAGLFSRDALGFLRLDGVASLGASFVSGLSFTEFGPATLEPRVTTLEALEATLPSSRASPIGMPGEVRNADFAFAELQGLSMASFTSAVSLGGLDGMLTLGHGYPTPALGRLALDPLREFADLRTDFDFAAGGVGVSMASFSSAMSIAADLDISRLKEVKLDEFGLDIPVTLPLTVGEGLWGAAEVDHLRDFGDLNRIDRLVNFGFGGRAGISMASFSSALSLAGGVALIDNRLQDVLAWDPLLDVDLSETVAARGFGIDDLKDVGDLGQIDHLIDQELARDAGVSMTSFTSALSFGGGMVPIDDRLADILTWDPLLEAELPLAQGGLGFGGLKRIGNLVEELRDFGDVGQVDRLIDYDLGRGQAISMTSFTSALSFGGGGGMAEFDDRLADILTWDPLVDADFPAVAPADVDILRDFNDLEHIDRLIDYDLGRGGAVSMTSFTSTLSFGGGGIAAFDDRLADVLTWDPLVYTDLPAVAPRTIDMLRDFGDVGQMDHLIDYDLGHGAALSMTSFTSGLSFGGGGMPVLDDRLADVLTWDPLVGATLPAATYGEVDMLKDFGDLEQMEHVIDFDVRYPAVSMASFSSALSLGGLGDGLERDISWDHLMDFELPAAVDGLDFADLDDSGDLGQVGLLIHHGLGTQVASMASMTSGISLGGFGDFGPLPVNLDGLPHGLLTLADDMQFLREFGDVGPGLPTLGGVASLGASFASGLSFGPLTPIGLRDPRTRMAATIGLPALEPDGVGVLTDLDQITRGFDGLFTRGFEGLLATSMASFSSGISLARGDRWRKDLVLGTAAFEAMERTLPTLDAIDVLGIRPKADSNIVDVTLLEGSTLDEATLLHELGLVGDAGVPMVSFVFDDDAQITGTAIVSRQPRARVRELIRDLSGELDALDALGIAPLKNSGKREHIGGFQSLQPKTSHDELLTELFELGGDIDSEHPWLSGDDAMSYNPMPAVNLPAHGRNMLVPLVDGSRPHNGGQPYVSQPGLGIVPPSTSGVFAMSFPTLTSFGDFSVSLPYPVGTSPGSSMTAPLPPLPPFMAPGFGSGFISIAERLSTVFTDDVSMLIAPTLSLGISMEAVPVLSGGVFPPEFPPSPSSPPAAPPLPLLCSDGCLYAQDFVCDDGGANSQFADCEYGDDCSDCGPRPFVLPPAPPLLPSPPPLPPFLPTISPPSSSSPAPQPSFPPPPPPSADPLPPPPTPGFMSPSLGTPPSPFPPMPPEPVVQPPSPPPRPLLAPGTPGCVSPTAINYESSATIDDGSCEYLPGGCTNSSAANFNPAAIVDDGSCIPHIVGCAMSIAANYKPNATKDDGSCTFIVSGCTDSTALNYYDAATVDDGSCIARREGCMTPLANNYDASATVDDGSCVYTFAGCTDPTALNYRSDATLEDGSCIPKIPGCVVPSATNYNPAATIYNASCVFNVAGCTNSSALNYNPLATIDDANVEDSCIFAIPGCTISIATNYDPSASVLDGSCIFNVLGCTDPTAANYYSAATLENPNRPCIYPVSGCMSPIALNYNSLATFHMPGSCEYAFVGCTDPLAINFVEDANVDDGSCIPRVSGCNDPAADNYNAGANSFLSGACLYSVNGCTDSTALNYNVLATVDDGSCVTRLPGCTAPSASNYDSSANVYDGSCAFDTLGCTNSVALNFASTATVDDSSCVLPASGCMLPSATNYDPSATIDDGSCVLPPVRGCTDSAAINWRPSATTDDGSCNYIGCTQTAASNYDATAQIDDGSCIFPLYGCTDSVAVNFLLLADADDGSCLYLGCTQSGAPNYDPTANSDDGSCEPIVLGCMDVAAANYASFATVSTPSACRYAGCTDSTAKNFNPSATFSDGSCVAYLRGCTNSSAINYNALAEIDDGSCILTSTGCTDSEAVNFEPDAELDDGSCLIVGCTDPVALNYDPSATFDDGCSYQYAGGSILNLGYLMNCTVFLDSNGNLVPDGAEVTRSSDRNGFFRIPYRADAPIRTQGASLAQYAVCVDSLTGSPVRVSLTSSIEATMVSSLTSIASQLVRSLGQSEEKASMLTCSNLIPCVPCGDSTQECDTETGCAKVCEYKRTPLSVFTFDPLDEVLGGKLPDKAWFAWLAAQMNGVSAVGCARQALVCSSRELCGSSCDTLCGLDVPDRPAVAVDDAAFRALAEMVLSGPVDLSDVDTVLNLFDVLGTALDTSPLTGSLQIAQECAASHLGVYEQLVVGSANRRRAQELASPFTGLASLAAIAADPNSFGTLSPQAVRRDVVEMLRRMCDSSSTTGRCQHPRLGCTRSDAGNFDPLAVLDDGSCDDCGCRDVAATNFNPMATCDAPGICKYEIRGCTIPSALNFDPSATRLDGSCRFATQGTNLRVLQEQEPGPLKGCTHSSAINYSPLATFDDNSCVAAIPGCTDPTATDFDPSANLFTRCTYAIEGCLDSSSLNFLEQATTPCNSCCIPRIPGCTVLGSHPYLSTNYNASATVLDGSCQFTIVGCTEPSALNYVPEAESDDGSCVPSVPGCIDSHASNYLPDATVYDGSCTYDSTGCMDSAAANYDAFATLDDDSCFRPGCPYTSAFNYDPGATVHDGTCVWPVAGCSDSNAANYVEGATAGVATCEYPGCMISEAAHYDPSATFPDTCELSNFAGCTSSTAANYAPEAVADDGSCRIPGCTDSNNAAYDPTATFQDDASCQYVSNSAGCTLSSADNYRPAIAVSDNSVCIFFGCTDSSSVLYSAIANLDDGTCEFVREGCVDSAAANYDVAAHVDDGSCMIPGCTDTGATNYDASANSEDGTCIFPSSGCTDTRAANYQPGAEVDDGTCVIIGCTDSTSYEFDSDADVESGECSWSIVGCMLSTAENYSPSATTGGPELCAISGCSYEVAMNYDSAAGVYEEGSCVWPFTGCTDSEALNFLASANIDDGTCYLQGCTDSQASNFDPEATADNGECLVHRGCTSLLADNFDSAAQVDDGSCIFIGCTDPVAANYDTLATIDSGKCTYGARSPPPPTPTLPPLLPPSSLPADRPPPPLPLRSSPPSLSPSVPSPGTNAQIDPLTYSNGRPLETIKLDIARRLGDWLDDFAGLGSALAGLDDVNGDKVPDVIVGAQLHQLGAGGAIVALLRSDGGVTRFHTIGRDGADTNIDLRDNDSFGASLARIGDLDGDGISEIAVGAPGDDDSGPEAGAVYVLFLRPGGSVREVQKINGTSAGMTTAITPASAFGSALAVPGDLNGDGLPDLVVGAPLDSEGCQACQHGAIYILFLDEHGRVRESRKQSPSSWLFGVPISPGAGVGHAMSVRKLQTGELNIALGIRAPLGAVSRRLSEAAGGTPLLLKLGPSGEYVSHAELELPNGLTVPSGFGGAIAYAPDWDGNGSPELIVGAPEALLGSLSAGAVYVLFMSIDGLRVSSWERLTGPDPRAGGSYGRAITILGDVNADLVADIVIGAPGDERTPGAAYLLLMTPLVSPSSPATQTPAWLWALLAAIAPLLLMLLVLLAVFLYRRHSCSRNAQPLLVSLVAHEPSSTSRMAVAPNILSPSGAGSSAREDWAAAVSEDEIRLSVGASQVVEGSVLPVPLQSVSLLPSGVPRSTHVAVGQASWPPTIVLPLDGQRGGSMEDDVSDIYGFGDKDYWGSGASSPESWGTSTLSIIDRQDEAEGGDLVDSGLEVTYQVNYPHANA